MGKLPIANKNLGQHFLKDQKVITTITQNFAHDCEVIVEIGPGPAVLTRELCKHQKPLYVVEMDDRFIPYLLECTTENNIFLEDALHFDWSKIPSNNIWLVSNLPYNISAPLLINFIPQEKIKFMSLMFQKEVAQKSLMSKSVDNSANSLGLLSHCYFEVNQLIKVLPGAFHPPPKVDSLVLSYKRKETPHLPLLEFERFEKFLRGLFSQKRKQIQSVAKAQGWDLSSSSIDLIRRAETLTLDEIISLYRILSPL